MIWLAVTPDKYEQVIFCEDSAKALASDLGIKEQTVRRQKWYWEHRAKNDPRNRSRVKYKIKSYWEDVE